MWITLINWVSLFYTIKNLLGKIGVDLAISNEFKRLIGFVTSALFMHYVDQDKSVTTLHVLPVNLGANKTQTVGFFSRI